LQLADLGIGSSGAALRGGAGPFPSNIEGFNHPMVYITWINHPEMWINHPEMWIYMDIQPISY
jgi:hypothetical protein